MKKLLLVVGLVVLVVNNAYSMSPEVKAQLESLGYYQGDPTQNRIIDKGEYYVVINNPSVDSPIFVYARDIEGIKYTRMMSPQVMEKEAEKYCKERLGSNSKAKPQQALNDHTTFYYCDEIINTQEKFNLSTTAWICTMSSDILGNYYTQDSHLNYYKRELKKLKKQRMTNDSFKLCIKEFNKYNYDYVYDFKRQRKAHKDKFTNDDFIYSVKVKLLDVLQQQGSQKLVNAQQKKMETCSAYGFEVGSDPFGQCIFKLMELELEYAKLENERMRLEGQRQQAELNNQNDLAQSLALQSMAAAQDKSLRIQQFGMFMQGLQQLTQPTPSQLNPKITCNQFGGQFRCW